MATVTTPTRVYTVKNLGWLLKHGHDVIRLEILPPTAEQAAREQEARLMAILNEGRTFGTEFASLVLLREFLERPIFRGKIVYDYLADQVYCVGGISGRQPLKG